VFFNYISRIYAVQGFDLKYLTGIFTVASHNAQRRSSL